MSPPRQKTRGEVQPHPSSRCVEPVSGVEAAARLQEARGIRGTPSQMRTARPPRPHDIDVPSAHREAALRDEPLPVVGMPAEEPVADPNKFTIRRLQVDPALPWLEGRGACVRNDVQWRLPSITRQCSGFDSGAGARASADTMVRSPQPLQRIIAADATLASWQARRQREEALTAAVRRELPRQLGGRLRATISPAGEIELLAPAGAIAAAVRQRLPDLLTRLQQEGWPATGVRVRVQVVADPVPETKAAPRHLDSAALAPLAELSRGLPKGPLRDALARFLRRSSGR